MSSGQGRDGTCGRFWKAQGYGNTVTVGTSVVVPDALLFIFRIGAFAGTSTILIYYTVVGLLNLQYMSVIVLGLSAISFGLAAVACAFRKSWFAKFVTVCYHVFFTFSVFITPVYWLLEFPKGGYVHLYRLYPHGGTIALFVIDIAIGGQLEFRVFDLIWVFTFGLAYIAFMFIRLPITNDLPYGFLDYRDVGILRSVITLILLVVAGMFIGLILVLFSRITRLYRKTPASHPV